MSNNEPSNVLTLKVVDSNLLKDFCNVKSLKFSNIKLLLTKEGNSIESMTPDDALTTDPRIEKFKEECKYCSCIESQYDHNKRCIHFGFFRFYLQKILHSIPFHIIVSLLVLIDVIIVVLELTIETRELADCLTEADCNNTCESRIKVSGENNETEHLVCGFIGLSRVCIPESEEGIDASHVFSILTMTILSIFLSEIVIKLFAFGFRLFLKHYELFDMFLVISSLVITIVQFIFEESEYLLVFELLIILRLWRIVRVITASVAAYSSVKEEKLEEEIKKIYKTESENIQILIEDYALAKSKILNIRQSLLLKKVNPFPNEYKLSLAEAMSSDPFGIKLT